MKHRERERKRARKKPFRNPKPLVWIVCEGANTEPEYFWGLVAKFRKARVQVVDILPAGVPLSAVRKAKEVREEARKRARREGDKNAKNDTVWCVFDRDEHPNVPEAFAMAKANKLDVAFSNPCFELWLLIHFDDPPGLVHRDKATELLKKQLAEYGKEAGSVNMEKLIPGLSAACKRAEKLCKLERDDPIRERNPYTDVHRLASYITES